MIKYDAIIRQFIRNHNIFLRIFFDNPINYSALQLFIYFNSTFQLDTVILTVHICISACQQYLKIILITQGRLIQKTNEGCNRWRKLANVLKLDCWVRRINFFQIQFQFNLQYDQQVSVKCLYRKLINNFLQKHTIVSGILKIQTCWYNN